MVICGLPNRVFGILLTSREPEYASKVENIPDEVVSEKLLRDLTRALADFLYICVKQDLKKGMTRESANFAHPHMVEFLTSGHVNFSFFILSD